MNGNRQIQNIQKTLGTLNHRLNEEVKRANDLAEQNDLLGAVIIAILDKHKYPVFKVKLSRLEEALRSQDLKVEGEGEDGDKTVILTPTTKMIEYDRGGQNG